MYSYGDGYASHKTDRQEQFERKESEGMSDWQLFTSSAIGLNVIASGGNVSSSSPSTVTVSPPTADGSGADSVCWGKCSQWLFERRSYILNKVALSVVRDIGVQLPIRKGARVSKCEILAAFTFAAPFYAVKLTNICLTNAQSDVFNPEEHLFQVALFV